MSRDFRDYASQMYTLSFPWFYMYVLWRINWEDKVERKEQFQGWVKKSLTFPFRSGIINPSNKTDVQDGGKSYG